MARRMNQIGRREEIGRDRLVKRLAGRTAQRMVGMGNRTSTAGQRGMVQDSRGHLGRMRSAWRGRERRERWWTGQRGV